MTLCHYVEVGKGISNVERAVQVLFVEVREDSVVVLNKSKDHGSDFVDCLVGVSGGELAIGGIVREVV